MVARCQDTEIKFKNSEIDTEETLNDERKKKPAIHTRIKVKIVD